jgi:hypothetical protein
MNADIGAGLPSGVSTLLSLNGNTYSISPYSVGAGFNIDLGGSYTIGNHIGAGLDLTDMIGFAQKSSINISSASLTIHKTGSLFAATPYLSLFTRAGKFDPYARFGIVIGSPSYTWSNTESGQNNVNGTNTNLYSGGFAVGWYAAGGVQIAMNHFLSLNIELFDRDLTYLPTTLTNTQAYDGYLKQPTIKLVTSESSVNNLQVLSGQVLSAYTPFGSVGIKAGISMRIEKGTKPLKAKRKRKKRE